MCAVLCCAVLAGWLAAESRAEQGRAGKGRVPIPTDGWVYAVGRGLNQDQRGRRMSEAAMQTRSIEQQQGQQPKACGK
ncbi:hypothetical protein LY76DRAFT_598351 [Colletotrichum caudatum]|nr:hypothetical protein LY76DRAFT_598351 [Colletotrichum caudatum]